MTKVVSVKQTDRWWQFLPAILVIVRWTKPIFEIEPAFDGSNPYMNFGRNQAINDYSYVEHPQMQSDRRRAFCRPF